MAESREELNEQPGLPAGSTRKKTFRVVAVVIGLAVIAAVVAAPGWFSPPAADGDATPSHPDTNATPQIAVLSASTARIAPLDVIALSCEATDADGDGLTYEWSSSGGEIVGDGPDVEWRAPSDEGLYRVFVTVSDRHGGVAEQSLALQVRVNNPPEILVMESSLTTDVGWVVPGARVYIRCEADDQDGDVLTYQWSDTAGELYGVGPAVIWVAPQQIGLHWVTVIVEDTYGGSAQRALPLTVNVSQPPLIMGFTLQAVDTDQFKPYGDSWRIFKERSCAIHALVNDPDGVYQYEWNTERGVLTGDGPDAIWQAPASPKGWVTIILKVSDSHGNQSSASVRIYVETCPTCMNS